MPMYDYQCRSCKHVWEDIVASEKRMLPTTQPCPECGENSVEMKISANIGDPFVHGRVGPSNSFKDLMKQQAINHPRGHIKHWK